MKIILPILVLQVFGTINADIDPYVLMDEIDQMHRADSSKATIAMTIANPEWSEPRSLKIEAMTEGTEKSIFRILFPPKDAKTSTLRIGKEMWNYFPKIRKTIRIPPSMMMGRWMGSDFTNEDIVKQNQSRNVYNITLKQTPDEYILTAIPKSNAVSLWGKVVTHVTKKNRMPVSQMYFNEKNQKIREMIFSKFEKISNRLTPTHIELKSIIHPGRKTTIHYEKISWNIKLPANTFSLRSLRGGR